MASAAITMVSAMASANTDGLLTSPFAIVVFIIFVCVKILKLLSVPECPQVRLNDSPCNRMRQLIESCPILSVRYIPTLLWARNGHFQTAAYGIFGHVKNFSLKSVRMKNIMKDGGTSTFDIFEPETTHERGDITLAICPGIANSSESSYVRNAVHWAQAAGYRCAVLNHLGALKSVKLTSKRIFFYGGTEEYASMLSKLSTLYPTTRFIVVGFSMGANIITKYLGEGGHDLSRVVCGISVCQGYDANSARPLLHQWEGIRRLYMYIMTENMKRLLRRNREAAIAPYVESGVLDESALWAATSLVTIDENYSRKVAGFSTVEAYYTWCSSAHYMPEIRVPIVYLNAADDPIVPPVLWEPAIKCADTMPDVAFVQTRHGGHLGFLEGSILRPSPVTWLSRFVVEIADAAVATYGESPEAAAGCCSATH